MLSNIKIKIKFKKIKNTKIKFIKIIMLINQAK